MMDYYTYSKPKMWANVISGVLLYVLFAYELHSRLTGHSKGIGYLLFLILAVNCTFRVFAYAKLKRLEKSITDERQLIHAERRQGLIITLFSNATAMLGLLLFLIHSILIKGPAALDIFFLFCAICFGGILILTIQNLRRLDK
jgi:hypothetical protein